MRGKGETRYLSNNLNANSNENETKKKKKITLYRKNKIHRYSFHISKYFLTWKEHSFSILRSISKRQLISSSFSLTAILHSNANENKNARKIFAKIQFSDIHSPFSLLILLSQKRGKKEEIYHNLPFNQSHKHTISLKHHHPSYHPRDSDTTIRSNCVTQIAGAIIRRFKGNSRATRRRRRLSRWANYILLCTNSSVCLRP